MRLDMRAIGESRLVATLLPAGEIGVGNIGVDQIVFSDRPSIPLNDEEDFGSMALALLDPTPDDYATSSVRAADLPASAILVRNSQVGPAARLDFGDRLVGVVGQRWKLEPSASRKATFLVAWHFPALPRDRFGDIT